MNIGKWVEYSSLHSKLVTNGDKNLHEPVLCSGGNGGMCHVSSVNGEQEGDSVQLVHCEVFKGFILGPWWICDVISLKCGPGAMVQ